jgi:hypothetical protein
MRRLLLILFTIGSVAAAFSQEKEFGKPGEAPSLNEGISLKIVKIEAKKMPADLNFALTFEIANATDSEVYVPNPRVEQGIRYVQPEFFGALIGGADCYGSFMDMDDNKKGSGDFTRIGPSESVQFTINPRDLNFNPDCTFRSNEAHTVQIRYSAQESFFDPDFLYQAYADSPEREVMMDIYAKVIRGTLLSDVVEFEVE